MAPALEIDELIANRMPWHSLDAAFYTSEQVFKHDIEAVFGRTWIFAATEAEIPLPGDYVTVEFGRYSVIVVRDSEGQVRAFHNVCRHRGSRLLREDRGSVGNIVCPYHQWTYGVDGSLRFAESTPPGFDASCYSLRSVHARSVAGLIYLCLGADTPPDFDEVAAIIESYVGPHRLANAKVAAQIDLVENGNWKLTVENNRECYHCAGHPELSCSIWPIYAYPDDDIPPRLKAAAEEKRLATIEQVAGFEAAGLPYLELEELDTRPTGFRIEREAIAGVGESISADGSAPVKRLLADFPSAKMGRIGLHTQPNAWFHVMADHAITFAALPLSPDRTLVRTTWLVHADAVEGVDYDVDNLTSVWKTTNLQDAEFVERAHAGVTDPAYIPGPYNPTENQVEAFVNWYLGRLRAHAASKLVAL